MLRFALAALFLAACANLPENKASPESGTANPGARPGGPPIETAIDTHPAHPVGWASVNAVGRDGTTGGGDAAPVTVGSLDELTAAAMGTTPAVIQIAASMTGIVRVGSNKTIEGTPDVVFTGHIEFSRSVNVILRNLKIVGFNCTDVTPPDTCEDGDDAVTINNRSHHIWVDHCDIADGSDGNLDIVNQADYVTISWTKFSYAARRQADHQFSNLIGSADTDTGDAGHLRVTFDHDWWAANVHERMPRARFGQIHLFNNLYTSGGDLYCVGVGFNANILLENNVFSGVATPVDINRFTNMGSVAVSWGNLYTDTAAAINLGTAADVFVPPYPYSLEPTENVADTVSQNVGPR